MKPRALLAYGTSAALCREEKALTSGRMAAPSSHDKPSISGLQVMPSTTGWYLDSGHGSDSLTMGGGFGHRDPPKSIYGLVWLPDRVSSSLSSRITQSLLTVPVFL